jgi:YHS domain-containing protein
MKAPDPVCGMQVNIERTTLRSEHRGQKYYFCTAACRNAFDVHPERYVNQGFARSSNELLRANLNTRR